MEETLKNYEYFLTKLSEFFETHAGEHVILKDCKEQGFYKTFQKAYSDAIKKGFAPGTFIVQKCVADPDEEMIVCYPLVG